MEKLQQPSGAAPILGPEMLFVGLKSPQYLPASPITSNLPRKRAASASSGIKNWRAPFEMTMPQIACCGWCARAVHTPVTERSHWR
jgi:hypothetical protein